jgi:sec-independent protein translocase protein TatB
MLKANRLQWMRLRCSFPAGSCFEQRPHPRGCCSLIHFGCGTRRPAPKIRRPKAASIVDSSVTKLLNRLFPDDLSRLQTLYRGGFVGAMRGKVSLPFMGISPPIELGSLGMADSLILMVLALVVFGPRRLPQIGRQIGKLMYEFRKASNDFKYQMEEELRSSEEAERRKKEEEQRKQLAASQPPQESVSATPAVASSIHAPAITTPEALTMEQSEPRIMPPSTGEPVASSRRSESAELTEPPKDDPSTTAPRNDNAPATEAVSPNG